MILHTVLAPAIIILGLGFFIFYLRSSNKERFIKNYLRDDVGKQEKSEKILDLLDSIVPSSLVMNEGEINEKIINAGYYTFKYPHLYMPIKYTFVVVGLVSIIAFNYNSFDLMVLVSLVAIWIVLGLIFPDVILEAKVRHYRSRVSRQLPYIIDLLAVCVQTGMTIESSLVYLSKEIGSFDPKTSLLLSRVNDRANMVGLEKALDEVYDHIPTSEMRSFVMTLKQSLQYGSSIYNTLTVLSADIRKVSMLTIEEKIGKLAAKMSVPLIIFIMLPIVILIAVPGVMRMMSGL